MTETQIPSEHADAAQSAELKQLGDLPIADVLAIVDRDGSDYRDLYYRWEQQQWEAGSIDLTDDRRQWDEMSPELRRSLLWALSSFYVGEDRIVQALVPFVDAAPTEEQQVFLTTQLVDEARHTVFFDRFYADVVGQEASDMGSRLELQVDRLNEGSRRLLLELLPAASDRIRSDLGDFDALVRGVALCHIVIEGVVGLTVQRFLLDHLRGSDLLGGFRNGFTAVARDETRHVAFGKRFLADMIDRDERFKEIVRDEIAGAVPVLRRLVDPPQGDQTYFEPFPFSEGDLISSAQHFMQRTLGSIGIELDATA